jgi:hypothetical protein
LFQTNANHESKLVVSISGNNMEFQWNDFLINDLSKTVQKWEKVNKVFSLPPNFYQGGLIKIYVLNESNTIIYIDDFKIKFIK